MGKIRTTVNYHSSTFILLENASDYTGLSRNAIVKACINTIVFMENREKIKNFSQISYQERDDNKKNWVRRHISLTPGEYEYLIGMRNSFKMSVSFIIAWAVRLYIRRILNKDYLDDNYLLNILGLFVSDDCGVLTFARYWGLPPILYEDGDNNP